MGVFVLLASVLGLAVGMRDFHVDAMRGNDANDGLTADTAWRTMLRAQEHEFAAGDRLLLRAGCIWRLQKPFSLCAKGSRDRPVFVARYGEGAAPELRASLDGLAMDWREGTNGLWTAVCGWPDVGNIVWGEKCGFKKTQLSDVKNDGDFFHDKPAKRILFKCPENPRSAFKQMEICRRIDVMRVTGCRNVIVDGIAFMYTGAHGLRGCDIDGLVVRNCTFGWIGGSFLREPCDWKPRGVRYGNGIEVWANGVCRDILVERCRFHDIYDTAMTNQGTGEGELDGMRIVSNRTERCEQSYEYWFTNPGYKVGTIEIRDNTFEGAGFGWSHVQRPNKNATHILSGSVKCPKGRIIVDGNRFGSTVQRNVWHMGDGGTDWLEMGKNEMSIHENNMSN